MGKKGNWQIMKYDRLVKSLVCLAVNLCLLSIFLGSEPVWAASTRGVIAAGNQAYNAGDFATALQKYQEAAARSPESAHVQFDLGNGLYKTGDFAGAVSAYERAAELSDDPALVSRSKYNLGNSLFQEAEKLRQTDPGNALQSYQQSADFYRAALDNDADFSDAARNMEVSKRRIAVVKQEMQKQPQDKQQKSDEQNKDEQDKDDKQGDDKQQSQNSDGDKDSNQEQGDKGQDSEPQDEADKGDSAESGDPQPDDKSAQDKSSDADKADKDGEKSSAGQQDDKQDEKQPGQSANDQDKQDSGMAISAEDLLNEEKENSLIRQQNRAGRYEDVEKDW